MRLLHRLLMGVPAVLIAAGSVLAAPPGGGGGPRGGPGPGPRGPGPGAGPHGPGPSTGVRVGVSPAGVRVGVGPGPSGVRVGGPGPTIAYGHGGYYGQYHHYPVYINNRGGFYGGGGIGIGLGYPGFYGGYVQPIVIRSGPPVIMQGAPLVVQAPSDSQSQALPESPPPGNTESALQITDVNPGPARDAGLQRGDVIFKADDKRIQTFDDFRSVLNTAKDKVTVTYWNPATSSIATKDVAVLDTKIGVAVVEVPVVLGD